MFGIAIELRGECPHCGNPVMVNALTERIHCPSCLRDRCYPFSEWADLLESAWELRPRTDIGHGGNTTVLGENWHVLYARFDPYCFACKHDFDMESVLLSSSPYACPGCSEPWHHRPAPPEAMAAMPGLVHIVAEHPGHIPGLEPDEPAPAGAKPILFACMGCGGSLEVDGSDRVITCKYCDASNYLPDDLWLRMHPVETVRRWFMWVDERQLPPSDQDEDEDAFFSEPKDDGQANELSDLLDEFDPPEDQTLEGDDDPAAFEAPFEPSTPRQRPANTKHNDLSFWLIMIMAVALLIGAASIWALIFWV